jgi:hypothetical protein
MIDRSLLLKYRWKILAALFAAVGVGVLCVRWWQGPQVATKKGGTARFRAIGGGQWSH